VTVTTLLTAIPRWPWRSRCWSSAITHDKPC